MKHKFIHPITRKRLQRFRKVRYAYWSLVILLVLYGLSLFSELLCNNRPLYVRCNGKGYFPLVKFYPEDTFVGNGVLTRPNYKAIHRLPLFQDNDSNYMIFAPVPYGPSETLTAEDIETSKSVTVEFVAEPSVAVLYVNPRFEVEKLRDPLQTTGIQAGDNLADILEMSLELRLALRDRFANRDAEALHETVGWDGKQYDLKLTSNKVRSKPRDTTRIYLNEVLVPFTSMVWKSDEWRRIDTNWSALPAELREQIETMARNAAEDDGAEDIRFTYAGASYVVKFSTEQVIFPFRPCRQHILGLDSAGRDVLVLLLYGMRIAFSFGIVLVIATMVLGTAIGAFQGYYAGKVDIVVQRLIEIWQTMPFLYILILIGSIFGRSFMLLLFLYGIFNWIGISYYMRAEFLKLRKMPFVEAAQCMGVHPFKIMRRHILPNALVPLVTFFPFSLVGAISALTALDYLGFGLPAGTPSWGELFAQAQEYRYAWWLIVYPFIAVFLVILLSVFIGDGVRAAFDPKKYSRMDG